MCENKHKNDALMFKALSDEKRLSILELLRDGEKCACVLTETTNIAQSALSYHMKILKDTGIVTCRNDGKYCHYRLSIEGNQNVLKTLEKITTPNYDVKSENLNDGCGCNT